MLMRCSKGNKAGYKNYGGRGITICDRWTSTRGFFNFVEDMGEKPFETATLDRIDNDGNYEPSNCRWTTVAIQNSNKTNNRILTIDGRTATISEHAKMSGITFQAIHYRYKAGVRGAALLYKGNYHHALYTYKGKTKNITDWAKEIGIKRSTLEGRLRYGWTIKRAVETPVIPRKKKAKKVLILSDGEDTNTLKE